MDSVTSSVRDCAEELANWKLNSSLLYDYIASHSLEWPSLSVQLLSTQEAGPEATLAQSVLIGTHTAEGEENSVLYVRTQVPTEPLPTERRIFEAHKDFAGFAIGSDSDEGKFIIEARIPHPLGEPNRVCALPQNDSIFATISVGGAVTVFDSRNKRSAGSDIDFSASSAGRSNSNESVPTLSLSAHDQEGWGLSWSPFREGWLASAADDRRLCLWDTQLSGISGGYSRSLTPRPTSLGPVSLYREHGAPIQDVVWHPSHESLLVTVSDDGDMLSWDCRVGGHSIQAVHCGCGALNSASINAIRTELVAVGGNSGDILLYDLKKADRPLYQIDGHEGVISRVSFSPHSDRFIASCGGGRMVYVWDMYALGREEVAEDVEDGPPELLFTHAGHADIVNDLSWSANAETPQMLATVANDNLLQLWEMARVIYTDDSDDDGEVDLEVE